jgi:F-type H+-transporting ATPase subunit b
VRAFLGDRAKRIKDQISQARSDMDEAQNMKVEYEGKLKGIESERDEMLESARRKAVEDRNALLADAKREVEDLRASARASIEMEKERAETEMRNAIVDVSTDMSARVLAKFLVAEDRDKLVSATIAELEGMEGFGGSDGLGGVAWRT